MRHDDFSLFHLDSTYHVCPVLCVMIHDDKDYFIVVRSSIYLFIFDTMLAHEYRIHFLFFIPVSSSVCVIHTSYFVPSLSWLLPGTGTQY
jgi:hypothetical protein